MLRGSATSWPRRRRRFVVIGTVLLLALGVADPAEAVDTGKPQGFPLPSWLHVGGWLRSPEWGLLPRQGGGSADGKSHVASSAATRAGHGNGHAPGKGKGELPAYTRFQPKRQTGPSGRGGKGVFDPKTSKMVGSKSSATTTWFQNADGSVTKQIAQAPVNYQVSKGVWAPIDTSLTSAGGRYTEKANSLGVSFAARTGASSNALAQVALDGSGDVGWTVVRGGPVTASVTGSTATYSNILPSTTLTETAGPTGVKESIVLASPAAGNSWTFALDTKGLRPSLDAEGAVVFADASGSVVARMPLAYAYDSKVNRMTGDPATTWHVKYGLTHTSTGWVATVTVDSAWLNDPARVFPVTVDPTLIVSIVGLTATTYVTTDGAGDYSSATRMSTGECTASACGSLTDAVGFIQFPTFPTGQGYYATSASVHLFDSWTATNVGSASCSTANASSITWSTVYVAPVTQGWSVAGSKAYPGPSHGAAMGSAAPATYNACTNTAASVSTGDWVSIPITDLTYINGWSYNSQPNYGIAVYGATGSLTWRKYDSDIEQSYTPYLSVTYSDQAPQVNSQYPPNGYSAPTLTPELLASASRPADSTTTTALTYDFTVYDGSGTSVVDSGSVSKGDWTVPAGKLKWGQTYYWTVSASDGTLPSVPQPWSSLSIAVPQPVITSGLSQNGDRHGFDQSIGNYTTSVTDADVNTVGPALQVVRDYNSRDPRTAGAFGAAWSSVFDARATEQYDATGVVVSVTVTYPDGSQVGFGKNSDGTFSPPAGRFATLKSATTGYTLTDKNDTVYAFAQALGSGGYGITSVADASGRAVTFTWASGVVSTMTSSVSGRALHLTWSTPSGATSAHVATVYTDPVTGTDQTTDLTWKYFYSGDQLASVCDPRYSGSCSGASGDTSTRYGYATGSQYQSAVLDAGPHSLWALSEASGSVASSAVLANEGNDNGTYTNVTLGAAGPMSGSTATGATFNGSSSYVTLPSNLVASASYQTMSMWFKTTSSGVLFSYQASPLSAGTTTGNYTPSLYVGTSGKLYGQFWYGGGNPSIVSSGVVNDGAWHNVVLSGAGNTQTLYLDGAALGSKSGTIAPFSGAGTANEYVGAGFWGGGWPDEPHYTTSTNTGYADYFAGSIADVAFYTRPLVQADVTGLYAAAKHTASLLTSVTRPSGNTEATVAYDGATARVTSVVDENGGTWTLNTPTVTGTSDAYRSAVMGSAPAGYYRLGDTAGAASAYSEVNYGAGTYNNVTLGVAGPFADRTAASFDGSSSYLALPATDQVSTGPNSVEMWFKMTAGDHDGGVLFDEMGQAITSASPESSGWDPALYVGTDGRLHGQFWINSLSSATVIASGGLVNDGAWHHVVLSAGTGTQTLYLDGNSVGTVSGTLSATAMGHIYVGAGESDGGWPFHPTNTLGFFSGSIAEFAFYRTQLSATEVAGHYAAYKSGVSGISPTQVNTVTDPGGKTLTYRYDVLNGDRLMSQTDGTGATTTYGYDTSGFLYTTTDANGNVTTTGHDVRGNAVSQTTCQNQAAQKCSTEYFTYYPDDTTASLTTADPRNDLTTSFRDGRSSSATDTTYQTTYTYDAAGDRTATTTPAVPGFPSGRTTTVTYSDGTATYPAADSGTVPAGLPMSTTSPGGSVNRMAYFHNGDIASTTDADGLVTTYTYDGLGRVVSKNVNPGRPVAWWPLNQTSGTAVADASGTGNGATASNVTWSGGAGVFNGTSSQITAPAAVNTSTSFTLSAWVNISAVPSGDAHVITLKGANSNAAQLLYASGAKAWAFQTTSADVPSPSWYTTSPYTAPATGAWTHLVGVYDATTGKDQLYVNGSLVSTTTAASIWRAGSLTVVGSGYSYAYFSGSIANVQFYQRALSAGDVSTLYGGGYAGSTYANTTPAGLVTTVGYDKLSEVTSQVDPQVTDRVTGATHTATTSSTFDADGNLTSQTVADSTAGGDASRTISSGYNTYGQLVSSTDARGNTTAFTYDAYGNKVSETDAAGNVTTDTYNANGDLLTQSLSNYTGDPVNPSSATNLTEVSKAYDPAGRLAASTDAMGNVTSYTYTDNGLVATVTRSDPTGGSRYVLESMTYDAAGNAISKVTDNGSLTTNTTVDAADRASAVVVDPAGQDRTTTIAYTPNDEPATTTETNNTGYDRTAKFTYDAMGNKTSQALNIDSSGHPVGWWDLAQTSGSIVTDSSGTGNTATASSVRWTGSGAQFTGASGQQVATNGPVLTTTASYSVSAWVNLAATSTSDQTAVSQNASQRSGFYLQYDATDATWSFSQATADSTSASLVRARGTATTSVSTWYHLVGTYDSSTGAMTLYVNGAVAGTATNTTPIAASGSLAIGHDWWNGTPLGQFNGQVANVQAYQRVLSAAEVSTLYGAGRTGGTVASTAWQTTSWKRDVRGLPLSMTDGNGNTTAYSYDEAGQLAVTVAPTVSAEVYGSAAASVHPTTVNGYNTFGEQTESQDPDGNITTDVYDAGGNRVSETQPSYTPPGSATPITATTVWVYDKLGNLSSESDALNNTTSYAYDQLGDVATVTTPDGGVTHSTYDANGENLSVTDTTGAQTQATYDWMGRQVTSTVLERYPSAQSFTSRYSYAASSTNPGGASMASVTSPNGSVVSYGYDAMGDKTSATDAAGNTTTYAYNMMGLLKRTVYPDGTATEQAYDPAERPTASRHYDASGTLLTSTSNGYDGAGNLISATDARGDTTTFTYDATGMPTQEVQPVTASSSVTTSFGYDAAGLRTRYTDGRGTNWYTTYNSWGLKQSDVAPATATYSSAADSTTTYTYDANGRPTSLAQPGGATQSFGYDVMGDLLTQSGTGASAAAATRTFTYDRGGRITSAATSNTGGSTSNATSESFTYNDRGDLLTASGTAGSTSLSYNADDLLTTRADASGTTSYTYDTADRLSTAADPLTGTTLKYSYNTLSQPSSIAYGTGQNTRSFTYDGLHRLASDALKTSAGSTVASIGYGYDNNGNLTSKTTSGFGTSAANTYTYDQANRLTSWNNGTTTTAYSYDAAGNRIQVGSNVYTYDARDQLTSDGVNSYTYTAAGVLASQSTASGATTTYTSDAYGQVASVAASAGTLGYTYDALGRMVTRTSTAANATALNLQYSGSDELVASDGSYVYSRDPSGGLLAVNTAGGTTATGQLALTDLHTDVVGTFTATGSALTGSATYDPLGNTIGTPTRTGNLGYQSQFTDPGTGAVKMGSRWYNPATGQFLSKDTASINPVPDSAAANPFAYIGDNPMVGTDPSGHCSWWNVVCGAQHAAAAVVNTVSTAVSDTWDYASSYVYDDIIRPAQNLYNTYVAPVVHAVVHYAHVVVHHVRDVYRSARRWVSRQATRLRNVAHRIKQGIKHLAHAASHAIKTAYHAAGHALKAAAHAAGKAVKAGVNFVKNHAAAIASFALSTVAFMGCEAVLGAATAGVGAVAGAVACGAFAGMVGGLADQGAKCLAGKQKGACSVGSFVKAGLVGGVVGGVTGALGPLGGKVLGKLAPKALEVVGGVFGKGGSEVAEAGLGDGAESAAGSEARASATESAESTVDNSAQEAKAGEDAGPSEDGASCPLPHSFTGSTPVLMANGTAKPIDQVKVGDKITNSVPGKSGTETHTVDKVIVTTTDHDFVDVTIAAAPAGGAVAAKAGQVAAKAGRAAKRALTLAAAVAAVAAMSTGAAATSAGAAADTGGGAKDVAVHGATLTTTYHHPFYDETQSAFVDAQDLHVGDRLQAPTGSAVVLAVRLYHASQTTYDLTIGALHTYYVLAGATAVLVHNCSARLGRKLIANGEKPHPDALDPEAHHIVPENDPLSAGARAVLKKHGIDIDSPENGVWLGHDTHRGTFIKEYVRDINSDVINADLSGGKQAVLGVLRDTKQNLQALDRIYGSGLA